MATRKSSDSAANDLIPPRPTLSSLKNAAADCQACDLWLKGTQTVFGEGSRRARVMFIGEQPGNEEDLTGKPFVGPAGRMFDSALEEAGIDRQQTYVTNVVKHFKWNREANAAFTKNPIRRKSMPVAPGSKLKSQLSNLRWSWRLEPLPRRRCLARI